MAELVVLKTPGSVPMLCFLCYAFCGVVLGISPLLTISIEP